MNQYQIDIADMKCWVFRMAQKNGTCLQRTAHLFSKSMTYSVLSQNVMTFSILAATTVP